MGDLSIKDLVGRKVISATINNEKDYLCLDTDKGMLYLSWHGDCCSSSFIAHFSGAKNLIDATVLSAENTEWDDGVEIKTMGTKIKTDKGYIDIETRNESNGYYGGWIYISEEEAGYVPQIKMKPLKDF